MSKKRNEQDTSSRSAASAEDQGTARGLIQVHRCRFVEWSPHAIVAVAFNSDGTYLALARDNGDIELWNVRAHWVCERTIPGSGESTVQGLFWIPQADGMDRLFSAGLNARIIEWDLSKLVPKFATDSYGGAVWSVAVAPNGQRVVAACEDGSLRLFDVTDAYRAPTYLKSFFKHDARALSVDWREDTIVSGGADSTIRVWDAATGRNTSRITVEQIERATLIWAVKLLRDGTIVSGDSLGHVQFWDVETGTLSQSFAHHKADVLSLAVSPARQAVYASGIDSTVAEFRQVSGSGEAEAEMENDDANIDRTAGRWILSHSQRSHTHDVHALAVSPVLKLVEKRRGAVKGKSESKAAEDAKVTVKEVYLVSGGVDTQLCVYRTADRNFRVRPVKLTPFPNRAPVSVASVATDVGTRQRFLIHHDQTLQLWQLGTVEGKVLDEFDSGKLVAGEGQTLPLSSGYSNLLEIVLGNRKTSNEEVKATYRPSTALNLCCSTMSADGQWIACSDPLTARLYQLAWSATEPDDISLRSVDIARKVPPSHTMVFTPDSTRLICGGLDSKVRVFDLHEGKVVATFSLHAGSSSLSSSADDSSDDDVEAPRAMSSDSDDSDDSEEDTKTKKPQKKSRKTGAKKAVAESKTAPAKNSSTPSKPTTDRRRGLIRTLAVSPDGQWLASGDDLNRIHVYSLDALQYHVTLPVFDSPHLCMGFMPESSRLVVSCASNRFYIYDVDEQELSAWSRDNSHALPGYLTRQRDKVFHLSFDPARPSTVLLQAHSFLCHVDIEQPLPSKTPSGGSGSQTGRKKRRGSTGSGKGAKSARFSKTQSASDERKNQEEKEEDDQQQARNFRMIYQFRPLLFADFVSPRNLLVLERPWLKVMQSFPAPLYRHRYGS